MTPIPCEARLLDLVTYENGMDMQQRLVGHRQKGEVPDQILLLQHTPVITLGRGGRISNLLASTSQLESKGVRYFETNRGGDITYHGPGQIVGYPILHLGEGNRDVRKFVTKLEEVLIRTAAEYGIEATRSEGARGVWVGSRKLAAIGVRIARWVTSHGFALNVSTNLDHFSLITPCGLPGTGVTSIDQITGAKNSLEEVRMVVLRHFARVFERELFLRDPDLDVVKVVVHDNDRVLLLHRTQENGANWQPVTGTVEEGEDFEGAARRELIEEIGHDLPVEDLGMQQSFAIDPVYLRSEDRRSVVVFARERAFTARMARDLPVRVSPEEHDAAGWFTFQDAYGRLRWSDDREAVQRVEQTLRGRLVS